METVSNVIRDVAARKKKWIQKVDLDEGALHRHFKIPENEKIPVALMRKTYKALQEKAEDKKLNKGDSKLFHQLQFALNMR